MKSEMYKNLFENSSSVMIIVNPVSGQIVDANNVACRFYGYSKDLFQKMYILDINTLTSEGVRTRMEEAAQGTNNVFEFTHRLANGETRDVEVFTGPIEVEGDRLLYSIVHDVSDRKRMERQLAIEKSFTESLISSLPGVMYLFNKLGHCVRWNHNLETITGYSPDQIREMGPLDFIASEDRERVREAIGQVYQTGYACVEAGFNTIGGRIIQFLLTGYHLEQNGSDYLVGVGLDISDRVQSEQDKVVLISRLQESLSQVKQLSGLLPICASCKKIRDDKGYWKKIELYIKEHSEAEFSHGICPECMKALYPELHPDLTDEG